MKNIFLFSFYDILLKDTYNKSLEYNGFTPNGVCWSSKKSQYIRFRVLTSLFKKFPIQKKLKIADIGCGCAELLNYFYQQKIDCIYEGYDINKNMIGYCKKKFENINFFLKNYPTNICDISVMSGTYNYAVTEDIVSWEKYILFNLSKCLNKSSFGIVFNLQFEKKRSIRNNIYYTEITYMFAMLKDKFKKVEKFYSYNSPKDIYFLIYRN